MNLSQLVEEFKQNIIASGAKEKHAIAQAGHCARLFMIMGWQDTDEMLPSMLQIAASRLVTRKTGITAVNHMIGAAKQFSTFCAKNRYTVFDQLSPLRKIRVQQSALRRVRRAITHQEFESLYRAAAQSSRTVSGMKPMERATIYAIAYYTGLRWGEAVRLTTDDFDANLAEIRICGDKTKNGKPAVLPIPSAIRGIVANFLATLPHRPSPLFPQGKRQGQGAAMMRHDLKISGLDYQNEMGYADFHSLRHSYCTRLSEARVDMAALKTLARHHSAAFTLDRYAHSDPGKHRAIVDAAIPPIGGVL